MAEHPQEKPGLQSLRKPDLEVCMRALLSIAVLFLSFSWAAAQNMPAQSNQNSNNQTAAGQNGTEHSVEGCLSNSGGNYMLTSDSGKTYMLSGDTSKLSEHVGHEVIIRGTRTSAGTSAGTMSNQTNEPTIDVVSVKHISKTCKNAGAMSH
jgi:hypothetical protein